MNGERFIFPSFRRDPITDEIISKYMTEETIIHPYSPIVIASQIIDEFYRMKVVDRSGFYILDDYLIEVFNKEDIKDVGHFYCDYTNKTVYFHSSIVTKSIRLEYYGCGDIKISSNSIVTQTDMADDIVQTLDDILNSGNAGNLNESWGRVTYIQPSSNILQLTKNRRQYVTNGTLLTGTTIKLPTMELGDYLQLTLMFYTDSDLVLVFEDENIKFSNQPLIQAGRSYTFSFEYVEGTWYCEWVKLERYLKDYIFKAGDTCVALTGGYTQIGIPNIINADGKVTLSSLPSLGSGWETKNSIDLTNYSKLYVDLDYTSTQVSSMVVIGTSGLWVSVKGTSSARKVVEVDLSNVIGLKKITFAVGYDNGYGTLNVYNAWLGKNEFVDTSQEIFTTSEKNKLSLISASANKVIDSAINGNILIDNVEANVYTHPTGTNPHSTTKTDIGLSDVDNTSDTNKPISNATQNALNSKINTSQKGVANGVAQLDDNGIIPSSQLPSYVDDVLEYTSNSLFPATGESGKIYLNTTNNLTYRWTGSGYAEISPSIALGETSSTAYAGDKGKATTDKVNGHIINTNNPHNVTKADVSLGNVDNTADNTKNVLSATKLTTARNIFGKSFDGTTNIGGKAIVSGTYRETPSTRHENGALEIRECNLALVTQSDIGYAPQIGFHWGGRVGAILAMSYTGEFQFINQAGTGYNNLRINTLFGNVTGNATSSTKLNTARTIALTGAVTGSVNFDGSGNVNITSTVVDDLHNHIISNVDGLQTILDGKVDDNQVLTNVPLNAKFTDTVYVHPTNHAPSIITQDSSNRLVTDVEKSTWNGKATQATIDASIDKIQIGGRNFLQQSDFENGVGGFEVYGGAFGTLTNSADYSYNNTKSLKLAVTVEVGELTGVTLAVSPMTNFKGKTVTLSWKVKGVGSSIGKSVWANIYDNVTMSTAGSSVVLTDSWQHIQVTKTISNTATVMVVYWLGELIKGDIVYADCVKLEMGNKATDWTPAPEDVDSAIALKADKTTSGTTSARPIPTHIGQTHFDTTLGKPIWCKTVATPIWVDSTGTVC